MNKTQTQWIPVTKRIPDDFQKVLVWMQVCDALHGNVCIYGIAYQVDDLWYGDAYAPNRTVLAWAPLPPVYVPQK